MNSDHKNVAGLLVIRFAVTILLVWAMTTYLDTYFYVGGSWRAYIVIAALVTLLNFLARPVIKIVLAPLHFVMSALAMILTNTLFIWIVGQISLKFDPSIVTLDIRGWTGWLIAAAVFGISNWLLTH
ncbi:phage holin family protein [Candidatus Peregrinibacteria bacterium]|nr:phage holin family protein [Candidatus Peregrinibacteria bacterium]